MLDTALMTNVILFAQVSSSLHSAKLNVESVQNGMGKSKTARENTYTDKYPLSAHEADETALPGVRETANYIMSEYSTFEDARGMRTSALFTIRALCCMRWHRILSGVDPWYYVVSSFDALASLGEDQWTLVIHQCFQNDKFHAAYRFRLSKCQALSKPQTVPTTEHTFMSRSVC